MNQKATWLDTLVLTFDNDVPVPRRESRSDLNNQALRMKVGQSILIPYTRKAVCGNLSRFTGFKLTQKIEWVGEKKMLRIWRME